MPIFILFFIMVIGFFLIYFSIKIQKDEILSLKITINRLWNDIQRLKDEINFLNNHKEPSEPQPSPPNMPQAPSNEAPHSVAPPIPAPARQSPAMFNSPTFPPAPTPQFNNPVPTPYRPQPPMTSYYQSYQNSSPQAQGNGVNHIFRPQPPVAKGSKDSPLSTENWIGRNLLGIAASILIFVGLVFLGVLIYQNITDTIKIIFMFIISGVLTASGVMLGIKKSNAFTLSLTGCGCGAFFISIMITHIFFNRLNDIGAFSLLLLWTIAVLFAAKKFESVSLSVVAHIGMIISICFAYAYGLSDEKLLLLIIYQMVSIAVIVVGNILCCKSTYRFGLFVSLGLTLISSIFMWSHFPSGTYSLSSAYAIFKDTALPTNLIVLVFVAQFLCASFLSYLLSISTSRLEKDDTQMILHVHNKFLWIFIFFTNIAQIVFRMSYHHFLSNSLAVSKAQVYTILITTAICIGVLVVHAAVSILLSLKLNFNGKLESVSVLMMSGAAFVLIFWMLSVADWSHLAFPKLSFMLVPGLLLLLARRVSRNKIYSLAANTFFAIDLFFMVFWGYENLASAANALLPLAYMVIYLLLIWGQWFFSSEEVREKYSLPARLFSLLLVEGSVLLILARANMQYRMLIILITLTALITLLNFVKYGGRSGSSFLGSFLVVQEAFFVAINCAVVAFSSPSGNIERILTLILFFLTLALAFSRIGEIAKGTSIDADGAFLGMKITALVLAIIYNQTKWFDYVYIFSLILMVVALLSIIGGFLWKSKSLRIYGLVLTLFCVLKLVTYDVASLNSILRFVSLIGGGIICFIISAIYNYTVKKFDSTPPENAVSQSAVSAVPASEATESEQVEALNNSDLS